MLRRGASISKHGECLGERVMKDDENRPFVFVKYKEVIKRSEKLGAAILSFGIAPGQNSRIGIYSNNNTEVWLYFLVKRKYNL